MIDDNINNLINNIGVLTELWTITYSGFVRQGFNNLDAMTHTKAFTEAMVKSFMNTKTDKKDESND